jgi:uncharacterized protein
MTKIAIYINHPSQYYIFKNIIRLLNVKNIKTKVFIKEKDILEDLLIGGNIEYKLIYKNKKSNSIFNLITSVYIKNKILYNDLKSYMPDFLISCGSDVAQVGFLLDIPCFVFNDDDAGVVPFSAFFGWPFATKIFAPESCDMGYWKRKTIAYHGYLKLAYLHPSYFKPDKSVLSKYSLLDNPFFLIRSVNLTAHHDKNIRGLNNELVEKLIKKLSQHGKVLISSEKELPGTLREYKLKINPLDIHHILYFSSLLVGDSQSMSQEAAILGTPSVRFNDFVRRIGVLEELEHKYHLTFGISPDTPEMLINKVEEVVTKYDRSIFRTRADKMIAEMIDLPAMVTWFLANYPESQRILQENPDYLFRFI